MDIWAAIGKGDIEIVRGLISSDRELLSQTSKWGHSLLSIATECDSIAVMKVLCDEGCEINRAISILSPSSGRVSESMVPIMFSKSVDAINLLIERGADVTAKDASDRSVIFNVARLYKVDLLTCLERHGATLSDNERQILLDTVDDELDFRVNELGDDSSSRVSALKEMKSWCMQYNSN